MDKQATELANARAWVTNGPKRLKLAQERGHARKAASLAREIEAAHSVLAKHGGSVAPAGTPAAARSPVPPTPSTVRESVPSAATRPTSSGDHGWSEVMADMNRSQGLAVPGEPPATAPTSDGDHGWGEVAAAVSAETVPSQGKASKPVDPWTDAVATVNAEAVRG